MERVKRRAVEGPPDLAIEIVSPESVERDYERKRRQYQHFKVPEYWIIDEDERKVTLLRLDARGKYREVAARKGTFHSQVLEGFWLDPNWLWQDPFPDELETLQQLLGNANARERDAVPGHQPARRDHAAGAPRDF